MTMDWPSEGRASFLFAFSTFRSLLLKGSPNPKDDDASNVFTLAAMLISFAMGCPASAQSAAPEMQRAIQAETASGKFMGSVLVVSHEKILVNQGYGSANLEWNVPNSPSTKFRIGSVTKQFTAAAILLLEERGKLTLNDSVTKYVPNALADWKAITISDLLTHTSGIVDIKSLPAEVFAQWRPATPEKRLCCKVWVAV